MGTYYRHKRMEKAEVPYSFQCEHCGKESGLLTAAIVGPEAIYNSNFKTLKPDREEKLCREAHDKLVRKMKETYRDVVEKKIFSMDFNDQCPFCHQPQSWALAGLKKKMYGGPKVCLGVGTIIALAAVSRYFAGDVESLFVAAVIFGVGAVAALGCLVWGVIRIQRKSRKIAPGVKRFPVIEWDAVQNLLNEQ